MTSVEYHELLSTQYCSEDKIFKASEEDYSKGIATNLINGIFGGWLASIFEAIKDKDSYDREISNLNKYGAG